MYREFWRRIDRGELLNQPEEESVVLLGRIKGNKAPAVLMTFGVLGALYLGYNQFGLILALGQTFLAAKLYLNARNIDRVLPPDSERALRDIPISEGSSNRFLVDINIGAFHDFIRPSNALPFWSLSEAEKWLSRCGFSFTSDGKWEASRDALKFLDREEIISIEPSREH